MSEHILTTKQLAERWECSEQSIRDLVNAKKIKPLSNLPHNRFSVRYIEQLEEADCDPLSAVEKRRLLNENEGLRKKLEEKERLLKQVKMLVGVEKDANYL